MKKIAALLVVLALGLVIFAGCSTNEQVIDGEKVMVLYDKFVLLEETGSFAQSGRTVLCYHKDTHIMYYIVERDSRAGITTCWIFDDETGESHIGHYPEDY